MMTKAQAELELAKAKAAQAKARAKGAAANAEMKVRANERDREKRDRELAANEVNHVYVFDKSVSDNSVKACIAQLTTWSRLDPKCAIEIQVSSPGGSIFDGFHLIDYIRGLRDEGHEITMVGLGMVASMAGVLMQAASKRVMGENAFMLIHEGSLGAIGDFGDVEDKVKLMEQFHARILTLFEERAKPLNPKTTKAFIKNRWSRKDWWFPAADALKHGFIDEVR